MAHTHNWTVEYTATLPSGKTVEGIAWGRTREVARRKAREQHADSPHGTLVRTKVPVKVSIV